MGAVFTPEQDHWRFYDDSVAEPGDAQALESEDTKPTLPDNTSNVRMRVQIDETGGKKGTQVTAIEYKESGGSWTALGSANHWDWADGAGVHADNITTFNLTGSDEYGEFYEQSAGSDTIGASIQHEMDICMVPTGTVTTGQDYEFRVLLGGTPAPLASGATYPILTTAAGGIPPTSIDLDLLTLTASAKTLAVVPGAVSTDLDKLALTAEAKTLAVAPGAVSINLAKQILTAAAKTLSVDAGAVTIALTKMALTIAEQALSVTPGTATIDLKTVLLSITTKALGVTVAGGPFFTCSWEADGLNGWDSETDPSSKLSEKSDPPSGYNAKHGTATLEHVDDDTTSEYLYKSFTAPDDGFYLSFWIWTPAASSIAASKLMRMRAGAFVVTWYLQTAGTPRKFQLRVDAYGSIVDYTDAWEDEGWHHVEIYAKPSSDPGLEILADKVSLGTNSTGGGSAPTDIYFGAEWTNDWATTFYYDALEIWNGRPADYTQLFYCPTQIMNLDKLALTASAKTLALIPGEATIALDRLELIMNAKTLGLVPGAVAIALSLLSCNMTQPKMYPWTTIPAPGDEGFDFNLGLVGYWSLEEDAGSDRVDFSTQGNDLEEVGTSGATVDRNAEVPSQASGSWSAGNFRDADEGRLHRINNNLSASFPGRSGADNPFTIGAWVYPLDFPNERRQIISKGLDDIEIYYDGPGSGFARFGFIVDGNEVKQTLQVPLTPQWYFVALRYHNGPTPWMHGTIWAETIYDRIPDEIPREFEINNPENLSEFNLGARFSIQPEYLWDGYIDEAFCYDRVLSEFELNLIIQFGLGNILGDLFIQLDRLPMTISEKALGVIPGATAVSLPTRTMTVDRLPLAVDSQVSISLDALTLSLAHKTLSVTPGAVTIPLPTRTMTIDRLPLDAFVEGQEPVNVFLSALALTIEEKSLAVVPGPVSVDLDPVTLQLTEKPLTALPGEYAANLDAMGLTINTLPVSATGGPTSVDLPTRTMSISAPTLIVEPGAIEVALGALGLSIVPGSLSVIPGDVLIDLQTRELIISTRALDALLQFVTVNLKRQNLTLSTLPLTVTSLKAHLDNIISAPPRDTIISAPPREPLIRTPKRKTTIDAGGRT
jgi:hypothetical protein